MLSPRGSPGSELTTTCLTGGPGGGKSTLLATLGSDPALTATVAVMEESIRAMRFVRMDPRTPEFQCALVATQAATEDSLRRALAGTGKRLLVTHRGTLDPCAFWQSFGNPRESFFEMTGTRLGDHYQRYDLVIHMETAARRVPEAYVRYPNAHRPEDIEAATRLDVLLEELWRGHSGYTKIEGTRDIEAKVVSAVHLIRSALRDLPDPD